MILKDIHSKYNLQFFKYYFFNLQFLLLREKIKSHSIISLIIAFASVLPILGFLTQNSQYVPSRMFEVIKYFLVQEILKKINIKCQTLQIVLFILSVLVFFSLMTFIINNQSQLLRKIAVNVLLLFKLLAIPIIQFQIHLLKNNQVISHLSHITLIFVGLILLSFLMFIRFNFSLLRSKNAEWKLQNKRQFYFYCLNIIRLVLIIFTKYSSLLLIISLIFQLYLMNQKHMSTNISNVSQILKSYVLISLHLSLLVANSTRNQDFSLQIFLFLSLISLIKCLFAYFKQMFQSNIQLPLCQNSSFEFYDCYFRIEDVKQKTNKCEELQKNDQKMKNILQVHKNNCKNIYCIIKSNKKSENEKDLDIKDFIKKIIEIKSIQSKENDFIRMIWKYEVQDKYEDNVKEKQLSIQEQFIIYCLERQYNQVQKFDQIQNDEEQIEVKNKQFYTCMNAIMKGLSMFYSEVTKNEINVLQVINKTQALKQNADKLEKIYKILIKSKAVTYKMNQLYSYYKEQFTRVQQIQEEQKLRNKAIILKNNENSNEIQQIHHPALIVYPDTGNVQNFNMELLALLKYNRNQLKAKNINDFIRPFINIQDQSQKLKIFNKNNCKVFIIDSNQKQIYVTLQASQRIIKGARLYYFLFKKERITQNKNIYLTQKHTFKIQRYLKEQSNFKKNKEETVLIKWKDIFSNYILSNSSQLFKYRLIKKKITQFTSILMIATIEETFNENFMIIGATLVTDIILRQNRVSILASIQSNQSIKFEMNVEKSFCFYYRAKQMKQRISNTINDKNQDSIQTQQNKKLWKLCLCGSNEPGLNLDNISNDIFQLGVLQKKISNQIVENILLKPNVIAKNFKTYRLFDKELYNIDLQDKQAYLKLFQPLEDEQQTFKQQDQSSKNIYMLLLVIGISITLISFSFVWGFSSLKKYSQIQSLYQKFNSVQIIRISLNQMNGILRDVQNGLYSQFKEDWKLDMKNALNNIAQVKNSSLNLFDHDILKMYYENIYYNGTLSQLLDILLSKLHYFLNTQSLSMIPLIQNTSINYMVDFLNDQKQHYSQQLQMMSDQLLLSCSKLTFTSIPTLIILSLLIFKYFAIMNQSLGNKLTPFLKISDKQAKQKTENAEKVSYVVQMSLKNFDIQLKNLLNQKHNFQTRKKAKSTTVGLKSKLILALILISIIVGNIVYLYSIKNKVENQISQINSLNTIGASLLQVYTQMASITNQYSFTNYLNKTKVDLVIRKMDIVEKNRENYPFSAQNNQLFLSLLYNNLCSPFINQLLFSNRSTTCQEPTPKFSITNPYVIGIDYYLRKMHYNIINNITDTYGSTGIFSFSFATIFQYMAQRINDDGKNIIVGFKIQQNDRYNLLAVSYLSYIGFLMILAFRQNKQSQKLKKVVQFLKLPYHHKQSKEINFQQKRVNLQKGKSRKLSLKKLQAAKRNDNQKSKFSIQKKGELSVNLTKNSSFFNYKK